MNNNSRVLRVPIEKEVQDKFLSYAMSVIVSRALPNVDDGFKPVHRRILYAMHVLRLSADKPYKKSARIVGEVIGKFHPHGDAAVYEAMTKMIQTFASNYPLIDGHGNFGSIDGDSPAAMRYTEVRLSKIAQESLADLQYDTVNFVPNYDESEREPWVLPGIMPNLLLNGSVGIAVGMATSIPPHNITEVLNTIIAYLKNPEITVEEIVEKQLLTGPDFPTGAFVVNKPEEIINIFKTGRGSYKLRAKYKIEDDDGMNKIIIEEIPYQINKSQLIQKIIELVKDKRILTIRDLRDESNRLGIRIVITLQKEASIDLTLNQLFKLTNLQTSYSVNTLALHDNQPELMNLRQILHYYVDHQIHVIVRKTQFLLKRDEQRLEILQGLSKALEQIDQVIPLIKKSLDAQTALQSLINFLKINERQAKAILEMKLQRLTALEQTKIFAEVRELETNITQYQKVLSDGTLQKTMLKTKLIELRDKYGKPRMSTIIAQDKFNDIDEEDLIAQKRVLVCITKNNYLKRVDLDLFRNQKRGGVGIKGITLNEGDEVKQVLQANTHDNLLFFTDRGKVYQLKAWKIPDLGRTAKGTPAQNLINIDGSSEHIRNILLGNSDQLENLDTHYLFFITAKGLVKKTPLAVFARINQSGKIAIKLRPNDDLSFVFQLSQEAELIISKNDNKIVRFSTLEVPILGRSTQGVIGARLSSPKDLIIGASYVLPEHHILSVSSDGKGKITNVNSYRKTKRGAKGVLGLKNLKTSTSSHLVNSLSVTGDETLLIARSSGKFILSFLKETRITKTRTATGARLVNLEKDEFITAVSIFKN